MGQVGGKMIRADIARQVENYSIPDGDRGDAVAHALRRFYQRVALCPCMDQSCVQCRYDIEDIEAAWDVPVPSATVKGR